MRMTSLYTHTLLTLPFLRPLRSEVTSNFVPRNLSRMCDRCCDTVPLADSSSSKHANSS